MKFKSICLSSMLIYGLYAGTAYPEAVLTSKAYVDNKVPAYNSATESQSLLTDTTTTGTIAKRAIFTDGTTYVAGTHANQIPTMGAVMSAITANSIPDTFEWSNTSLIAAGRYSTDFDGTYGNYPVADATKLVNGTAFATGLSMKQNRINGHAANAADSLLTDTTTTGTIAKRAIFNDTAANYDSTTQSTQIPTMGAVMSAISSATPTLPTGTNGNIVTYNAQGQIGGSLDPATLQTAIPARATKIDAGDSIFANSVVTNGTTDGDVGQMAILTADYNGGDLLSEWIGADSIIPTMGAVADALQPLPWYTAEQNATGAYNTTFANSGTNVWPTSDATKFVQGETFANAMATKQNKIPMATTPTGLSTEGSVVTHTNSDGIVGEKHIIHVQMFDDLVGGQENWNSEYRNMLITAGAVYNGLSTKQNKIAGHSANAADSLLTDSTTAGTVQKRAIFTDGTTYVAGTHATQIPTMGAVMSAISSATPTLPTGTPGTAVLYDNNGDIGDERAISDAAVYTGTGKSRELSNGTNLATITAVETKQNAITPRTSGNLVAYNGDDENGQALFTARSVMDASDVDDVINNSNGSWQEMGTEIRRSYTNDIVSGGAMGTALEKLGQAVDVLNSEVDNKQNKATCTMTKPGDSTVCYAYTFANVRSADTP